MHFTETDVDNLLGAYARLRRRPSRDPGRAVVGGMLAFEASAPGKPTIAEEYRIRLEFSLTATRSLPKVFEEAGRIPRADDNHVNRNGDLCLGSPLRILQAIGLNPTLVAFVDRCVIPFLYAASWREQGWPGLPFDELAHGVPGLIADYERMFSVTGQRQVAQALFLLSRPRRIANKLRCPCGCGRRLAKCRVHGLLVPFRRLAPRSFYFREATTVLEAGRAAQSSGRPAARSRLTARLTSGAPLLAARRAASPIR